MGFCCRIKKLFNLVPTAHRARFVRREVVDDWLDESGRVLLVGDAAHPLLVKRTKKYYPRFFHGLLTRYSSSLVQRKVPVSQLKTLQFLAV